MHFYNVSQNTSQVLIGLLQSVFKLQFHPLSMQLNSAVTLMLAARLRIKEKAVSGHSFTVLVRGAKRASP